jgi:ATP-dependent RNA helicase RhlE
MAQNKRQKSINGFRNGKYDILVATDVASRGIDVTDVSHVINFDMPNTVDAYIHRIGRTGRAEQTGEAFTFMLPEDMTLVRRIEDVLGEQIERRRQPDFAYGNFNPDVYTPRGRPNSKRRGSGRSQRQAPPPAPKQQVTKSRYGRQAQTEPEAPSTPRSEARPAVKSAQPRPNNGNGPNGPRRRRPRRRQNPTPATNAAD